MPQADVYPPGAFYFTVSFGSNPNVVDCSFCEVSGFSSEIEIEAVVEGGESRYSLQLPKAIKHQNLVLKRGVAKLDSGLVIWCRDVLDGGLKASVKTKRVIVSLMDEMGQPLRSWSFGDAFPVKLEVGPFQSIKNEMALEKVELSYLCAKRLA